MKKEPDGISIHAPPRGATANPSLGVLLHLISIHAPPRGATATALLPASEVRISIHAPPRGATSALGATGTARLFQFTPLREGRQKITSKGNMPYYFNSRPSARGDNAK